MILVQIVVGLIEDALRWLMLLARSDESVRAENLVLRRQLAKFIERGIRPARMDGATRISLAVLTRCQFLTGARFCAALRSATTFCALGRAPMSWA